ncbi:Hypothetical predicted protein [Mytilus galloprovincialis]|uniref:Uncharacterized protein n=1 Tax=Mytilus galloprovincialis TaxID=29158 RepID=A0A8B6FCQ8_MYTGA|nr:Hypothetical predicted protein [Mytilus galloprovincialis]
MESTLNMLSNTPDMCQSAASSYTSYFRSQLADFISHIDTLYAAVKTLLLQLFPEPYILSHSVSGKTANTKIVAKPEFDSRLYGVFADLVNKSKWIFTVVIQSDLHISSVPSCGTSLKQKAQPQESSSLNVAQKKPKMESTLNMLSNTPDMCQSAASSYTSYFRSQLADFISHIDTLYAAVKTLLLQLFPEPYILSHSVSGKTANTKITV